MLSVFLGRSLILLGAAAVTSALFINFCATVFQCGCRSLWAGADAACNIHAGPPHCPWCANNSYVPYYIIVAAQAGASFWPASLPWVRRLGVAIAVFPATAGALALIYGIASGYWKS